MTSKSLPRSKTFDAIAAEYDAHRPDYPEALVEAIIAGSGIAAGGDILEIGSGTGKATLPFARRGFRIHCVEPGRNLIAVAAEKLRDYPNVTFENTTFEDWPVREAGFDLVICAQAFHWLTLETRFAKTAQALKTNGWMALFWNMSPDAEGIQAEINAAYRECAPSLAPAGLHGQSEELSLAEQIAQWSKEVAQSGLFSALRVQQFTWTLEYDTAGYLAMQNTHSNHQTLEPTEKRALFDRIAAILDRNGGRIVKPYVAVLYLAQKA